MRAILLRHASAGDRRRWQEADRLRPLDEKGRRQAEGVAGTLAKLGAGALYSSPSVRCVETLEPSAALLDLRIEMRDELGEGASSDEVLGLLDGVNAQLAVLCTHGDVIEELLPGRPCKKGAIWIVQVQDREVRPDRYLLPPA